MWKTLRKSSKNFIEFTDLVDISLSLYQCHGICITSRTTIVGSHAMDSGPCYLVTAMMWSPRTGSVASCPWSGVALQTESRAKSIADYGQHQGVSAT